MVFSFIVVLFAGFGYPVHAYVFSSLIFKVLEPNPNEDPNFQYWINFWNGMFILLGVLIGGTQFL